MTVINVDANSGIHLPADSVPGNMHVYCVGPGPGSFGISIVNAPPPYTDHHIVAGHMLTFQIDNFPVWLQNYGPSKLQLLYTREEFQATPLGQIEGAESLEAPRAFRWYTVRIVGPAPARCALIVDCTGLQYQKLDNCYYKVRSSLNTAGVEQLFKHCAAEENCPDAGIEVEPASTAGA